METPLTPLEFERRSRKLYPEREAVVAALQALGVKQGDRVAYIVPNTYAQLESQ